MVLMKILAFTGAGISKQSNIPTFMEQPEVREKLFRDYANTHHEEYNEVIRQLKANMNGAKPNDVGPLLQIHGTAQHHHIGGAGYHGIWLACRHRCKNRRSRTHGVLLHW